MAKELTAETLEELTAACMELPWLDEVRLSEGQGHSVTIVPSDDVSTEEKLIMTFEDKSIMPRRILALIQDIAVELGCEQPPISIVHAGGARYTLLQTDGRALSIPTAEMSAEM
jgi:hypothetical protein